VVSGEVGDDAEWRFDVKEDTSVKDFTEVERLTEKVSAEDFAVIGVSAPTN
jgi:hypothetical protein